MQVSFDICNFESKHYIVLIDYYSKFIYMDELKHHRSRSVIERLKAQFSRHGIPWADDPKYTAEEFKSFCEKYGISHQTSSPHTIHTNGDAQTVKKLWNKTVDNHLALLDYRTTPPQISCFVTCSSTDVPAAKKLLVPKAYWQGQPAATTKS